MDRIRLAALLAPALMLVACGEQAPGAAHNTEEEAAAATTPAVQAPSEAASAPQSSSAPAAPMASPIARTTSPAPSDPDEPDECGASKLGTWLNALPTANIKARIAATSGARAIRYIGPGDMVTMDFSPGRLNVETGEDGRIKRFRCG